MLTAVYFPDLQNEDPRHEPEPLGPEEALEKANSFLADLDSQGATIIAIVPVKVKMILPQRGGVVGGNSNVTRQMFIINTP